MEIPDSLFQKPTLQAKFRVPEGTGHGPVITTEVADNIAEIIRREAGVIVRLAVDERARRCGVSQFNASGSKYLRDVICTINGRVDVYAVLEAFAVTCPARQHAVKKLLCTGIRGKGDTIQDLTEARDAIDRAIQMQQARNDHTAIKETTVTSTSLTATGKMDLYYRNNRDHLSTKTSITTATTTK